MKKMNIITESSLKKLETNEGYEIRQKENEIVCV